MSKVGGLFKTKKKKKDKDGKEEEEEEGQGKGRNGSQRHGSRCGGYCGFWRQLVGIYKTRNQIHHGWQEVHED